MKWTSEEERIIKDNYKNMSDIQLMNLLPNRSKSSIESKRKDMGFIRPKYKKYSFDDVIDEFSNRNNYILLSTKDEFIDCNSKMRYICKLHTNKGEQYISLNHMMSGRGCKYCGRKLAAQKTMIHLDKESDKKLCESKNFEYVDTVRENGKIKIVFICNNHRDLGEQKVLKSNMNRNQGCKYCCGKELPEWYVLQKSHKINPNIKLLEPYKNLTTRIKCLCTKHNLETNKTMQQILKGQGCCLCGSEKLSKQKFLSIDEVQNSINKYNPHIKIQKYNGANVESTFYCLKHKKIFKKCYSTLLHRKSGCDECYAENIRERQGMGIEEFKNRLQKVHPELIVTGEYVNNSTPINVYCQKHNYEYALTPVALLDRLTCCNKTRITYKEENICQLLEKWGFNITRQKIFDDCIDKRALPFDIYFDDFNTIIEYQGEQHYQVY